MASHFRKLGKDADALRVASERGHEQFVELLLNNGADINAQGGKYRNALQAASLRGHEKVVELLLNNGADVSAHGGLYGNALQAASLRGHEKVVELLLYKGADVNSQGGLYGNALQAASQEGHRKVVELLLNKGADVNAQGGHYGNALQAASLQGHEKVVELLLHKGADINAQGGLHGNALQAASLRGHEKVVELLLHKGLDVNTQGGLYGNALQAASLRGHEKVVDLLLNKGADINAQGGLYGNALQAASLRGHGKVVELLLYKGVDVNTQGEEYGNALQAASLRGHEKVVELLLNKGADINAQGGLYGNALQAASLRGHEKVVELLLNKGVDLNAQGKEYGDALHVASLQGHEKVVELLLYKGADVNAQGGHYRNALQAAVAQGHGKVVELLFNKGADLNAQGNEYGNPLQAASARVISTSEVLSPLVTGSIESTRHDSVFKSIKRAEKEPAVAQTILPWVEMLPKQYTGMTSRSQERENALQHQALQEHVDQRIKVDYDVEKLIADQDSGVLTELLGARFPSIGRIYPWTLELLDEGFAPAVVASLLLNSEHLQWLEPEQSSDNEYQDDPNMQPTHQPGCAHAMCANALRLAEHLSNGGSITTAGSLISLNSNAPMKRMQASSGSDSDSVTEDLDNWMPIDELEEHERIVMSICGVAGIFNPSQSKRTSPGCAVFRGGVATIIYEDHGSTTSDSQMAKIGLVFRNIAKAMRSLFRQGTFCDRFSVLVDMASENHVLRTATIYYDDILLIGSALSNSLEDSATEIINKFWEELGWSPKAEEFLNSDPGLRIETRILHLSALLAQVFSVGLVTYTRGHSREFDFNELSRSVDEFQLFGYDSMELRVKAKRVQLHCLGDMLRRTVWMFSLLSTPVKTQDAASYKVYSTIEDFCDIWGGRIVFEDATGSSRVKLQVGEGVLYEVTPVSGAVELASSGYDISAYLHYQIPETAEGISVDLLKPTSRVLIGAVTMNEDCQLSREACHNYISKSVKFFYMGTRSPSWKTTGRTANISGGAKGAAISFGVTQTKDNGRFLKADIIENKSLKALNSPWGLELSLCTGVARRVPLRKLLYGGVLEYLELELNEWPTISGLIRGLVNCRNNEFSAFIRGLCPEQKAALKKATELLLLAMEHTGTKDGDDLVLWWPEADVQPRGFRINKEWFAGRNPWLPMIKDSKYCAVFGIITSKCLQHQGLRNCMNLKPLPFEPLKDIVLETSVFFVQRTSIHAQVSFVLGQHLVWRRDREFRRDVLLVSKLPETGDLVVRLEYLGRMPKISLKVLMAKYDIMEQQALGDIGHNVLISQVKK